MRGFFIWAIFSGFGRLFTLLGDFKVIWAYSHFFGRFPPYLGVSTISLALPHKRRFPAKGSASFFISSAFFIGRLSLDLGDFLRYWAILKLFGRIFTFLGDFHHIWAYRRFPSPSFKKAPPRKGKRLKFNHFHDGHVRGPPCVSHTRNQL